MAVYGLSGLVLGLLAVGSPTGSGALVNLDLIAIGDLGVPDSLVGLGPEIPRRAPLQAVWALLSPPLSAAEVTRVWMILIVAVAFAGTMRLLDDVRRPIAAGAAACTALGPFLLTRLAVGHLGFATAVALLPWALPALAAPLTRPRRTLLWLGGFALCGYFGALVAFPVVVAGLLVGPRERLTPAAVGAALATQVPWLAPAIAALGDADGAAGSERFRTDVDTVADAVRLLVGFGFWRGSNQLGHQNAGAVLVALLLAVLAGAGWRWGRGDHRGVLSSLAVFGLCVAAASTVPGVDDAYADLTRVIVFAPLREGQRLLVFVVLALVVFAARGLDTVLDERPSRVHLAGGFGFALAAIVLAGGSWWGLDGAAGDHDVPAAWDEAAAVVESDPGLVLALPWSQYFDVVAADGRRGHHPVPFLIGGDVLFRHDLGLGADDRISRDDREDEARTLVRSLRFGEPIGGQLKMLGVRWIVALPDLGTDDIDRLRTSDEVETVLDRPAIAVFAGPGGERRPLTSWTGTATVLAALHGLWLVWMLWTGRRALVTIGT